MNDKNEKINCPICSKQFTQMEINKHIDKCLFLNTNLDEQQKQSKVLKRSSPTPAINSSKKVKIEHKDNLPSTSSSIKPLAEQLRPNNLLEFIGQEHLIGDGKILRNQLDCNEFFSMILWGPPGCGKTTIATIIANKCKSLNKWRFVKLSATMSGVNDIKEIVRIADNELKLNSRRTILFMDEIHRFNKLQQDIFLSYVESGLLILIGATTENPSFSLNAALLSRCRVFVFEKLSCEHIKAILKRQQCYVADDDAIDWLSEMCDGDARIALNTLQLAGAANSTIRLDMIKDSLEQSHMLYDRNGDEHYNLISAVHKSIRSSDDNAALYWTTRMIVSGEDPLYIGRRLIRAAAEDIGLADPHALNLAVATLQGCQLIGAPECDVLLGQCAVYLARAPKSRTIDTAVANCKQFINNFKGPQPSVPLRLRNAPTKLMKDLGYGKRNNNDSESSMPQGFETVNFFL